MPTWQRCITRQPSRTKPPKDGKEYVRKDGDWVESQTGNINAILDNINGEVV